VWFEGILAVIFGFLLQAAALYRGDLALVEPVLVLELPFTLALAGLVFKRRLHLREWGSAALLTAGVALLLYSLSPTGGRPSGAASYQWGIGVATNLAVVGVLIAWARRVTGARRAVLLGVATGAMFGLTAALMARMSESLSGGLVGILTLWQTYAMVATGIAAMYLLQNALQAGNLVAVQPGLTLTDPIVSILWGVVVFHERVRDDDVWLLAAGLSFALIAAGTISLSHSPLIRGERAGPAAAN